MQHVDVLVQADLEDVIRRAELEFGQEPAGEFLGLVAEAALVHAGNAAQDGVEVAHGEAHRAGKVIGEQQELGDQGRLDFGAIQGLVGVPRAARAEYGGPAEGVGLAGDGGDAPRRERVVAHVQDARGLVRALQVAAALDEEPALVADDGGVGQALEQQRTVADGLEKIGRAFAPQLGRAGRVEEEVEAVEFLPQLGGDLVAHHAGVLAGLADRGDDGVAVGGAEDHELGHILPGGAGVEFPEQLLVAGALDDGHPVGVQRGFVEVAEIEQELEVDVHQARDAFGALDVAAHPVEGIGDTAQHGGKITKAKRQTPNKDQNSSGPGRDFAGRLGLGSFGV